ncbi:Uncharacterised protein [Yersinia frederiksenii]|nr:Uncharacterised protein [Yersinia frederiksenii]CNI30115.1 Uncharacterised protein [Yersinia frederiksenii]CNL13211.1 Uncharacterised protein [Yersinia frederiksenii]
MLLTQQQRTIRAVARKKMSCDENIKKLAVSK